MSQNDTLSISPSLQDFSLIRTYVDKFRSDNSLQTASLGFSFFILDLILNLQTDEIEDSLTDSFYLQSKSRDSGHDRGIDAIYIDSTESPSAVHIFNFKYTEDFHNTEKFFPATEIDKILGFFTTVMAQDDSIREHINPVLFSKTQEIWNLFQTQNPRFIVHICANFYRAFEENEKRRFEKELSKYTSLTAEYHLMADLVAKLTHRGRQVVSGRVKAVDKNLFEKSGGDIRALIVELDARDLIRLVIDDEELRKKVDLDDYSALKGQQLLEDAFEDNVRIYLKQRSRINQNIKSTALGDESHRFFFYNNGITLTCSRFEYPRNQRGPIIELDNIQVVNGGQTVHALFEAFQANPDKFDDMEILCRVYQTSNKELSTNIAEYTK
jgi:AIPR protein